MAPLCLYKYKYVCVWAFAERQNHAREMMKEADLSQWDALVIMSGDGLLFEVRREIRIKNKENFDTKSQLLSAHSREK